MSQSYLWIQERYFPIIILIFKSFEGTAMWGLCDSWSRVFWVWPIHIMVNNALINHTNKTVYEHPIIQWRIRILGMYSTECIYYMFSVVGEWCQVKNTCIWIVPDTLIQSYVLLFWVKLFSTFPIYDYVWNAYQSFVLHVC